MNNILTGGLLGLNSHTSGGRATGRMPLREVTFSLIVKSELAGVFSHQSCMPVPIH